MVPYLITVTSNEQEKAQFEHVVKSYYNDVFRFAYSLSGSEQDASDLSQQAFLNFARKRNQIKDFTKVKGWLLTVTRNAFMDSKRKQKRYPHVELPDTHEDVENLEPNPSGKADWSTALAAMQQLPLIFREPLALFYLEGYTYLEISGILKVAPGTVMSRLSRGKARLKSILQDPLPNHSISYE